RCCHRGDPHRLDAPDRAWVPPQARTHRGRNPRCGLELAQRRRAPRSWVNSDRPRLRRQAPRLKPPTHPCGASLAVVARPARMFDEERSHTVTGHSVDRSRGRGGTVEDLSLSTLIWLRMARFVQNSNQVSNEYLRQFGITVAQFEALAHIRNFQPITQ